MRARGARAVAAAARGLGTHRRTGFARGEVSQQNGEYMLAGLALGLELCQSGDADAMCFAPLNKAALRAGGMDHADELH